MNQIIVVGNVGNAEFSYTKTGKAVLKFSVAVNKHWKGADGERKEETTWFKVTVWEKYAEALSAIIRKGSLVMVQGEVSVSAYLDKAGEAKASLEVRATNVQNFTPKSRSATGTEPDTNVSGETEMEDMPF